MIEHASDIARLRSARSNAIATLDEILASPKPSYSVHGHTFSWTEYQRFLGDQIENLSKRIAQEFPFELVTSVR